MPYTARCIHFVTLLLAIGHLYLVLASKLSINPELYIEMLVLITE